MRIIISPAKKMQNVDSAYPAASMPAFQKESLEIQSNLGRLSSNELQRIWQCNDRILANAMGYLHLSLDAACTPAILAYEGIQYQYMAPAAFTKEELSYLQEHLRILSGFYGVLRPLDAIVPYRLEMQAKCMGKGGLYAFWKGRLYGQVLDGSRVIVNLASEEYAKAVRPYVEEDVRFIDCYFGERKGEGFIEKGVYAKMARGEMVRFLAGKRAGSPEDMKEFREEGYHFEESLSSPDRFVFLR